MTTLADLGVGELTDAFEAGRVPDGDFTHADHVRVGWELLRRYPLGLALDRVTRGIRALAGQRGADGLYHATITTFYLLAIADGVARRPGHGGFEAFAAANPDLLGPGRAFLLAYYSPETLAGEIARRQFVLPERLPRSTGRPAAAGTVPLPPRSALGSGARPG